MKNGLEAARNQSEVYQVSSIASVINPNMQGNGVSPNNLTVFASTNKKETYSTRSACGTGGEVEYQRSLIGLGEMVVIAMPQLSRLTESFREACSGEQLYKIMF